MNNYIFPENNWYLEITEDNKNIVNNWRKNIIKYSNNNCPYLFIHWTGRGAAASGLVLITTNEFIEYVLKQTNNKKKYMKKQMLDILEKTYSNPILRKNTQPLFMSNPGLG